MRNSTTPNSHKTDFIECCLYKAEINFTYIDPRRFIFSGIWHRNFANVNASLYQELYRNSKNMHQDDYARYADYRFNFYRRNEWIRGKGRNTLSFLNYLINLLYDVFLGYGYGMLNAIFWSAIFLATVSFLTWIIHDKLGLNSNDSFIQNAYFVIVTFSTIGYGDISPKGTPMGELSVILFALISLIWSATVTAIIIKRIVK